MTFNLFEVVAATGGTVLSSGDVVGPVLTDTRTIGPGAWFLALTGERFDGHDFWRQAEASGACGMIVSRPIPSFRGAVVLVDDTVLAFQALGLAARARLSGPVVGLTGSAGKTTTRALIALALGELGAVHQTQGNLNNHLGVPMTLLSTPEGSAALVVEMGTSSPGEIGLLDRIAQPTHRLIVNIGPAHLEELGGLEGVASEKEALFRGAKPGQTILLNVDDPFIAKMVIPAGVKVVRYGRSASAEVRLLHCEADALNLRTHAQLQVGRDTHRLTLPGLGEHLVHNALGALAAAVSLGLSVEGALRRLERYEPVGMRLRLEDLGGGVRALNDAYNANPTSMRASLDVLAAMPGRRVAVLGDMLELGADEDQWHRRVVDYARSLELELVVLVGARMSRVAEGLWVSSTQEGVVERLHRWLRDGDVLLVKGSRGAKMERILNELSERRSL